MGIGGAFKKLGRGLAAVAPALAGAAVSFVPGGGVASALGRAAVQQAAEALGVDTTPADGDEAQAQAVAAALERATPDQLLTLKKADHAFELQRRELDVRSEQVHAGDRADARSRQLKTKDRAPAIFGYMILGGFFGILAAMMFHDIPIGGRDVLLIMVGSLGTLVTQLGNFYYGTSKSSESKQAQIERMIDRAAAPPRDGQLPIPPADER